MDYYFFVPEQTARGEIDAQESALAKARHQLQSELKKLGEYEKRVPELEDVLSSTKDKLDTTQQSFEEKTVALGQTRKHLKNARERNMVHAQLECTHSSF